MSTPNLAFNADGSRALLPSDKTSELSDLLLDVLTLLHAGANEAEEAGMNRDADADNRTSASSRAVALMIMADEKVRRALAIVDPYH